MHPSGPLEREEPLERPVDLRLTLGPTRRGARDRCTAFDGDVVWRASRTPEGPATLAARAVPRLAVVRARAWGPGAAWALDHLRSLVGADDDDGPLEAMLEAPGAPGRDLLRGLRRRLVGLRIPATGAVTEALVPSILEQKVTGLQARRSYRALVSALGEAAPGPAGARSVRPAPSPAAGGAAAMMVPPSPAVLAAAPSWVFHRAGVEGKRARTITHACSYAHRLDPGALDDPAGVRERLAALPGVGAWTVAEVSRVALGDPDAVSVGDYHLHNQVAWALAGLARGGDDVMLELLEPYRGQRGRVTRLIEAAGIIAPRFGPRLSIQAIEAI